MRGEAASREWKHIRKEDRNVAGFIPAAPGAATASEWSWSARTTTISAGALAAIH
jgi:hypothetical protein